MKPTLELARAPLIELFASIQGEGAHVGRPQLFLRLAGCPLRCAWCDTPESWRVDGGRPARVSGPRGERGRAPWVDAQTAARWVDELEPRRARALSVTGGEPLMWPEFLLALRAALPERQLLLETAGAHPTSLARVIDAFDHLSLDLKLPADMQAPVELGRTIDGAFEPSPTEAAAWRAARRGCLSLVADRDACAKIVVAAGRPPETFKELLADLAELAPSVPLVLQPVTPTRGVGAPTPETLERLTEDALRLGLDVSVLPQIHPQLGFR